MPAPSIILASASPRRAQLMRDAGYRFAVKTSPVEEPTKKPRDIPTELWPMALAFIKAQAVQKKLPKADILVIGADTIVVLGDQILNKPKDARHARQMLLALSGKKHEVHTGVALLHGDRQRLTRAVSVCRVRKLAPAWLDQYIASGLWKGKAGAYGIQDHDDPWVSLVSGEWSNVVGLPMALLRSELQSMMQPGRS